MKTQYAPETIRIVGIFKADTSLMLNYGINTNLYRTTALCLQTNWLRWQTTVNACAKAPWYGMVQQFDR